MDSYLTAWKQASFGEYDGLKLILDNKGGGKFDDQDDRGFTPLCWAARNGHLQVMNYLIELGCDKEIASFGGMRRKKIINFPIDFYFTSVNKFLQLCIMHVTKITKKLFEHLSEPELK
jgi:ankyrin repeat protein